mgnify:CR=1 FL=1
MYWITKTLGTASENEVIRKEDADEVIYVTDLNDGWNPPERIYLKVKEILIPIYQRKRVVLKCKAGISRSNGIATLILAYLGNTTWDDAYTLVRERVPIAQVNPDFRDSCIEALKLLNERLVKNCPYCNAPIEFWETACSRCWYTMEEIVRDEQKA